MHALTSILFLIFALVHLVLAAKHAARAPEPSFVAISQIKDGQIQAPTHKYANSSSTLMTIKSSMKSNSSTTRTSCPSGCPKVTSHIYSNTSSYTATSRPKTIVQPSTVIMTTMVTITIPCPSQTCPTMVVPSTYCPGSTTLVVQTSHATFSLAPPVFETPSEVPPPLPKIETSTAVMKSSSSPTYIRYTQGMIYSPAPPVVPPSSKEAPPPPASPISPPPPSSTCPLELGNTYATPRVIALLDSTSPGTSSGPVYFPHMSPKLSTVFTFDIPASFQNKTCYLSFGFPLKSQLETSSYNLTGSGNIKIDKLSSAVQDGNLVNYSNVPSVSNTVDSFEVIEGSSYEAGGVPCPAGHSESYELSSVGGVDLEYFEDYNPCPIGLFVVAE